MDEINLLKSLWKAKPRRIQSLIVPSITIHGTSGSLNNEHWAYVVPYGSRDALDLKYLERKKTDKKGEQPKSYWVWTQGPIISFKEGDLFISSCDKKALQVKYAVPMGWDASLDEMYQGLVTYHQFNKIGDEWVKQKEFESTQMGFLQTLITGELPKLTIGEQKVVQAVLSH